MTETPVVTLVLPTPERLSWRERDDLRIAAADDYRREHGTSEPVGVDIIAE